MSGMPRRGRTRRGNGRFLIPGEGKKTGRGDEAMERKHPARNAGVDLLRIISMLMIVILHVLGQGGVLDAVRAGTPDYAAAYLLETLCFCAVNCYALISGYVGGDGHFRYAGLFETHARVLFYTVLITLGFLVFMPGLPGFDLLKKAFFPVMTEQYWYYTGYFGLMLFMPALQVLVRSLTRVQFRTLVVTIVLLTSLLPTVFVCDAFRIMQGYSIWWLAALYLTGAYIRKYGCPFLKKGWIRALVYLACVILAWGANILEAGGAAVPLPDLLIYSSPVMLLAGAALLTLFAGMKIPAGAGRIISGLSAYSFSVYLIHAHPLVWNYLMKGRFAALSDYPAAGLFFAAAAAAALIYLCCTLIDTVRALLFRLCRVRKLCEWLGARTGKLLEGRKG